MTFHHSSAFAVILACVIVAPAAGQNVQFDMRTGLWEITTERSSSGIPAIPAIPPGVLEKLPPDQRAQIEGAIRAQKELQAGTHVTKTCVDAETLRKGPDFGVSKLAGCKNVRDDRTARSWTLERVCDERGRTQSINIRYDLDGREKFKGTMDLHMQDSSRKITVKDALRGRWLSGDCGNVKPPG